MNLSSADLTTGLTFGCDYNPEQWPEETWSEDVELMAKAGVNLVAINIFGWSSLQSGPDRWDFSALDKVVELLSDHGIGINLGTGTASPPPWMYTAHPEILPMVIDGTLRYPGGRQAFCPSSPVFQRYACTLVEQVAQRYGHHSALRLWHVSNELGCHNARCYCDTSAEAFRRWLQERYGDIDALNQAWGTNFWSQRYSEWEQVNTPKLTLSTPNPAQVVDFKRFSSLQLLELYRSEAEIIRRHSTAPVTTNFMVSAHRTELDYWPWAQDMDVITNDHYLDHRLDNPEAELSLAADITRGLAHGQPWILMENARGAVNWQPVNHTKTPGEAIRNSLTHLARGANGICFFQWRASTQGAERFHSAMVPHAGTDTRQWEEIRELGAIMSDLAEIAPTRVRSRIAFIFSWEAQWSMESEGLPSTQIGYLQQTHRLYEALWKAGYTVDVVAPDAPLQDYDLIIVTALHLITDAAATEIDLAVQGGSHAVVTFLSGITDENEQVRAGLYPGAFTQMLGAGSEQFIPLDPSTELDLSDGSRARLWLEELRVTTATIHTRVVGGPWDQTPVITRNLRGEGTAWYISTHLSAESLQTLLTDIAHNAGLHPEPGATAEVEVIRRRGTEHDYVFFINHGTQPHTLEATGFELITQEHIDTQLTVPASQGRVLKQPHK